jgi:Holliday junction resolvase RusA-like endonuclease
VIPIEPVAKGRPRVTNSGHAFTPAKTRAAEANLRWYLHKALAGQERPLFNGPVQVFVHFKFQRPETCKRAFHSVKPDLDNVFKGLSDSLNGLVLRDDSQIISVTMMKSYSSALEIHLRVFEICPEDENKIKIERKKKARA